jgi:hypothetical protein
MKADHLCDFNFLVYINWKIQNKPIRHFSIVFLFVWSYGRTIHHSPGMNRNVWGIRLILKPCLEHRVLCVFSRWKLNHKDNARQSYRPVYEFTELITQRFQVHKVHLATAYADIKECAVIKEFCMMQSSCCHLNNQIYILTANKISTRSIYEIQVTRIKLSKFTTNSKILNTS